MVKIAILGYGTVGSGVAEVVTQNAGRISLAAARDIELAYILDVRDFSDTDLPFVKDFSVIEKDPAIQVVVECIGGVGVAYDFVKRSLSAGKSVVTSNKELVAEKGQELLTLAQEKNINFLFEASVGGGIPIIRPLHQCLAANRLVEVTGILNGTTNYILTRMREAGLSFGQALQEAQDKGYAERDPSDDIEGRDACRKICILASLAFGKHIYPQFVQAQGITGLTQEHFVQADKAGMRIKLLGRAVSLSDNRVCAFVAPYMVPAEHPLAGVNDVFNGIVVKGDAIGEVMFYGKGAGKLPTASAVVADVIDAAKHMDARKYLTWGPGGQSDVAPPEALPCQTIGGLRVLA